MEEGNSQQIVGLQFFLDLLQNDDPHWLSTNEFDDLLANLQALEALIWATSEKPVLWKWVIIAAHATLQSLAICKLTRTDGFGAKRDDIEQKVADFYKDGKSTFNDPAEFSALAAKENMANFPTLMRRLGYDLPKPEDARSENDATNLALFLLHDFRSTYAHYPPGRFTLMSTRVRDIVRIAVRVIDLELRKSDWKRRPSITLDEVEPLLASIQRRFEEIENG